MKVNRIRKLLFITVISSMLTACASDPNGFNQFLNALNTPTTATPAYGYGGYGAAPVYQGYRGNYDRNRTPPGSYLRSCRDIVVRRGVLEATCSGNNGGARTSISLDSCRSGSFENINGILQCTGGSDGGRYRGPSNRDLPSGS
ncbi:MAG: CVNH domain-containing protein, partial [Glaciimonas sp.]|nr:CVNH domain-containing protein [Glaciimonas sp.]